MKLHTKRQNVRLYSTNQLISLNAFLLGTKGIVQGNQLVNNSRRRRKVDGLNVANEFAPFGAGRGTQGKRIPAPTGTYYYVIVQHECNNKINATKLSKATRY